MKVESDREKTAEEVHAVAKWSTNERPGKCFRCGRRNHTEGQCPHTSNQCVIIVAIGHIQKTTAKS